MKPDGVRMLFGYLVLVILAVLAALIALGRIEEKTSFGLMAIISSLSTLAGSFAQWAFSARSGIDSRTGKQEVTSDESESKASVQAQGSSV